MTLRTKDLFREPAAGPHPAAELFGRNKGPNNWTSGEPYSPTLKTEVINKNPRLMEYLRQKLNQKILVDLGCGGEQSRAAVLDIAAQVGLRAVVFVDDRFVERDQEIQTPDRTVILLERDMLELATMLHPNKFCFLLSGMDSDISPNRGYNSVLAEEIYRATQTGGIVITYQQDVFGGDIVDCLSRCLHPVDASALMNDPDKVVNQMARMFEKS